MTAADDFKIDYRAAARDALNRVQQELVTKEIEQKVKLELENEKLQEKLKTFDATEINEMKAPSSLSMKLNVISGQRFGMVPQGSKIQSIISVAGHQVIRNLSEPSEFTLMHLDTYADYLRQVEPRTEARAVRALLTTGGPRTKKLHGRYVEVYGPYRRTITCQRAQLINWGMKAIGFSLEDEDASEVDHEDFMRGVVAKLGPRCFFCNLEGHFELDCPQFWDAVADIKHPRHEEALSGVKASKARLLSEAEKKNRKSWQRRKCRR